MFAKFVEIPCHRKRDIRFETNTVHFPKTAKIYSWSFINQQKNLFQHKELIIGHFKETERFLEVPVIVECSWWQEEFDNIILA